jgi:hypothetical protein
MHQNLVDGTEQNLARGIAPSEQSDDELIFSQLAVLMFDVLV